MLALFKRCLDMYIQKTDKQYWRHTHLAISERPSLPSPFRSNILSCTERRSAEKLSEKAQQTEGLHVQPHTHILHVKHIHSRKLKWQQSVFRPQMTDGQKSDVSALQVSWRVNADIDVAEYIKI